MRFLKGLVITLMITMIVGVITVVGVLVTRMPDASAAPDLPDNINLPAGVTAQAVTLGKGWFGIVTSEEKFLVFTTDGILRQEIDLKAAISP